MREINQELSRIQVVKKQEDQESLWHRKQKLPSEANRIQGNNPRSQSEQHHARD
ncbi:hypothetical protein HMPREF1425_00699 [Helicobacter pylori GAM71Ai]|nr:hypothetical protein HMPREF1425_00699 [Helicobacter pylori GAM71Ai]